MSRSLLLVALGLVAVAVACGDAMQAPTTPGSPAASSASAAAAVGSAATAPLHELRTGTLEPERHKEPLRGVVEAHLVQQEHEFVRVRIGWSRQLERAGGSSEWVVALRAAGPGASRPIHAFLRPARGDPRTSALPRTHLELWVRRPKSEAGRPLSGAAYRAHEGAEPGHHFRVEVPDSSRAPVEAALAREWGRAFADHLRGLGREGGVTNGWHAYAADRILSVYVEHGRQGPRGIPGRAGLSGDHGLVQLMETTTGATTIQAALQHERGLYLAEAKQPRKVPIEKVRTVRLAQHPFDEMLRRLGRRPPLEGLAKATPAEFYYLRFATLDALFAVVDQLDVWGTPAASVLSRRAEAYDLAERYTTALGVDRSELTRVLGPKVIAEVALVGSDPYLREGSDLTALFRVRSQVLFDRGLARALAGHERRHGPQTRTTEEHVGQQITLTRSADGAVNQLRADFGGFTVLSNSPTAIRRVIEAKTGRRPRLWDEPDFRYLLARDSGTRDDVLGFAGDRFVSEVVGPRQKILEARRQIALSELRMPGYAALLYGWLEGRSPASQSELVSSGLLRAAELSHHDGERIDWEPGRAARSSWGTSRVLTPLLDLPVPQRVSESEKVAYESFAGQYERTWATYVDPFMARLAVDPPQGRPARLTAELRMLPLLPDSDLRELLRLVGDARLRVPSLERGLRMLVGIGRQARVRQELSDLRHSLPGGHDLKLDWLGDWAMVGLMDDPAVTRVAAALERDFPEMPPTRQQRRALEDQDELRLATELPLYAVIAIRSKLGASLALAWARKELKDVAPDLEWTDAGKHGSTSLVRVRIREGCDDPGQCEVDVFYALTGRALVVALDEGTLRRVLDELRARPPTVESDAPHGQFVVEFAPSFRGALWTVASWYLEAEAVQRQASSRAAAEVLLRGAPDLASSPPALRQLGLSVFGAMPLTPDGATYELANSEVRDPARGTASAPVWPRIPVAGSPVEALVRAVRGLRWETSFDDEGEPQGRRPMLSLHVRAKLTLGAEP